MQITKKELKDKYGIELSKDKYHIYVKNNYYEIYKVKDDTEGCILVGKNKEKGKVLQSRAVFLQLMEKLEPIDGKEKITIEII